MKAVDRLLGGAFLRLFVYSALAFLGLFLVVDFFEKLRVILKHEPELWDVALYFGARLPWMASQVIPMATLLGTLLSVTLSSRHGEITAFRSAGVPLRRLAGPYLACGLGLSLVTAFFQEVAAPRGFAFAREIKELRIRKRPPHALLKTENLWLRKGSRILHVDRVGSTPELLYGVSVAELESGRMVRRVDAREARWEDNGWVLQRCEVRTFQPDGTFITEEHASLRYPLADDPEEFRVARLKPEEASWTDLNRRLERYRAQGLDTRDLEVGLWAKTSLPLVNLVMAVLAFPFGVRAGRRGSTSRAIVVAVGLGFVYWLVLAVGLSLGKAGALPPPFAAWVGNVLFAAVGCHLLWRTENAG